MKVGGFIKSNKVVKISAEKLKGVNGNLATCENGDKYFDYNGQRPWTKVEKGDTNE